MDALVEYLIPISGLKIGLHTFDFQVDKTFFAEFPDSLIKEGTFKVHLDFEKRIDLYELHFTYEGTTKSTCDRCLAAVNFPIKGENQLILKFAEEYLEDVDVVYIPIKTEEFSVAKHIYEYLSLAVPFIKRYNCEEEEVKPCDLETLAVLNKQDEESKDSDDKENPIWDSLKDIKFN